MKAIFSIIVALGIPTAFWNFYLKEVPDVRYVVSNAIPLFSQNEKNDDYEFVQQIEVANSGKAEAKKIVVKIPTAINKYNISKHSQAESVDVAENSSGLEINYPNLPPSAKFQVTLNIRGKAIPENSVEVHHQNGKAQILSTGSRSNEVGFWSVFPLILSLIYILLSYFELKSSNKYSYLFRKYPSSIDSILGGEKPWSLSMKDWTLVLEDLLDRALRTPIGTYENIKKSAAYVFLNYEKKPECISQNYWNDLRDIASEKLIDFVRYKVGKARVVSEISELLNTEWPVKFSEDNKNKISNELSYAYRDLLLKISKKEDLIKILSDTSCPTGLLPVIWSDIKRVADVMLGGYMILEAADLNNVLKIESTTEYSLLSSVEKYKIDKIIGFKNEIASLRDKESKLKCLENNVFEKSIANEQKLISIKELEENSKKLSVVVRSQLDLIEKIINEPEYIKRIESYDDTFTEGNWGILRKFAEKSIEKI